MSCKLDHEAHFDRLMHRLRIAQAVTSEIFSEVIVAGCIRLPVLTKAGKTGRIYQLLDAGAWTEAALALVELELPMWKLRRVVYEDGEWLCSLSRQPNLPFALDETAEANHEVLSLAILRAFVEARRAVEETRPSAVPQVRPSTFHALCCDNFV
jgi:hypothetical protein